MSEQPEVAHPDEHAHAHPPVPYFKIFYTLVIFTAITIAASFWKAEEHGMSKAVNVMLAFAIAGFKASLVMLFFMHLKYEKRPLVVVAMAPFALVVILVLALFPDIVHGQYHENNVPVETTEKK